jgi:hypothetical protein
LKFWLIIFGLGIIAILFALFIGFLPYAHIVVSFFVKKMSLLINFDTSTRAIIATAILIIALFTLLFSFIKFTDILQMQMQTFLKMYILNLSYPKERRLLLLVEAQVIILY